MAAMLSRFFAPENKDHRNMQVVFTLLTLNFILPSLSYFFAPKYALEQFLAIGQALGAGDYPMAEQSHLWRVLAFGNVFTLGSLTFLMQWDLRRWHVLIPIFILLKSCSALGFLYVYLFELHYRTFLAVFFFDGLAVVLVWWFGGRAWRAMQGQKP